MKKEQLILFMKVIIQIQWALLAWDEHMAWIWTTFSGNLQMYSNVMMIHSIELLKQHF